MMPVSFQACRLWGGCLLKRTFFEVAFFEKEEGRICASMERHADAAGLPGPVVLDSVDRRDEGDL